MDDKKKPLHPSQPTYRGGRAPTTRARYSRAVPAVPAPEGQFDPQLFVEIEDALAAVEDDAAVSDLKMTSVELDVRQAAALRLLRYHYGLTAREVIGHLLDEFIEGCAPIEGASFSRLFTRRQGMHRLLDAYDRARENKAQRDPAEAGEDIFG